MSTSPWEPYDPVTFYAHIVFGVVAYGAGILALIARKGSAAHVRGGWLFAAAMVVPALTTLRFLFDRFLPLTLIVAVADLYLIATGLMVFYRHRRGFGLAQALLLPVPVLLCCMTAVRTVMSAMGPGPWLGPILLSSLFGYLAVEDMRILRRRERQPAYWLRRHLTRMLLAFAFATTAVLNTRVLDVGLPFEVTVIGPLALALVASATSARRLES